MHTFLIISNLIAWALSALCLTAVILTRRTNRYWHADAKKLRGQLIDIEHKNAMSDSDHQQLKWYQGECDRLSRKCAAICRASRRMKGRGKTVMQCDPMHNF